MKIRYRSGASRHKTVKRRVASKPAGQPRVTVVVPAYNYGRFLADCVQSALTQRDVDVHVLIVDDCSTDDTPELTAKLAASDARVSVIRNQQNRGLIPTVNYAFERLNTEYVVKLDADDLLPPGSLARATALLEANTAVAFVYGRPLHFSGEVPRLRDASTRSWTVWSGDEWLAARCRSGACVISQPEVVIRASYLRRALPVREELHHTSDMHLWMSLASIGDVGRVNGPRQGLYRVHDASMQRTIHAGIMIDLEGRRAAFDAVFDGEPDDSVLAHELRAAAHESLAATALEYACLAYDQGRTGEQPVKELVAFAIDTCPHVRELDHWKALQRRWAVGERRGPRHPQFFVDAAARRISYELSRRYWLLTGEQ